MQAMGTQTLVGLASDFIIAIGCDFSKGTTARHSGKTTNGEALHNGNAWIISNDLSHYTLQF